jgi:nickel/cobalt transporter (NicO) family protein
MQPFTELLQQGAGNAWFFIPSAILLGALHGLEPGHSKTLMAAFIVAIKGTVAQAVMLGVAATISHTAVVWVIALGGMYLWRGVAPEALEPWFQLLSGLIIIAMALWMLWRARQDQMRAKQAAAHDHHGHDETRTIDTGHGIAQLEIFEDGVPPRWRLRTISGQAWFARDVVLTTTRPDGAAQTFTFRDRSGYLESFDEIPEPHAFKARVSLGHGGHSHDYDFAFTEGHGHHHHDSIAGAGDGDYQDAHERAHADDIRRKFSDGKATTGQIIVFGLTGGLIPCPAAITVLLLCLQLKEITLGAVLVLCFSIGLAVTLVTVGAAAALATRHAASRISWLSTAARRAPYVSGFLIIAVGLYVVMHGLRGLSGG